MVRRSGTFALAAILIIAWFAIARGRETVTIYELAHRGGASLDAVRHGAVWQLVTSQFVHVRRAHMLLNVIELLLLGWWLEPRLRTGRFLAIHLAGGAIGQLAILLTNQIATGASQSIAALAGAATLHARTRAERSCVAIVLMLIAALDLWFARTLKIGHVAGFFAGLLMNILLRPGRILGARRQ
ncbi:MAG TPA: rhomboid family intramembrane serine protease [Thermoanaerobaculia bacterium]|nr:rhomboid family intramembrane serine protease [Thermoanaerobaculia bacterium]